MDKKEKIKLILIFIIILILKIVIVEVQPINAQYTMKYDDQLMVNLAESIVQGKWLGEYNSLTLIKGVFTPIFIAIMYIFKIPFLMGKEIFYGISCILFVMVISQKIKNKIILTTLYLAILLNPVEYSSQICRVYRDGLYMSLIMYLLSFAIAIFLNRKENVKKQIKYYIGLGISFSAIYLCREETIWLVPFIITILSFTIIPIVKDKKMKDKKSKLALLLIPIIITIISINIICLINYKYYGVYTLNEYWGISYQKAYGALTRIIPKEEIKRVPVTRDAMQQAYEISPKFKELEEFLEGEKGKKWEECGEGIKGEINGGYFHWALINAAEDKGYYEDATKAKEYYEQLAQEINEACEQGVVECRKTKRISNVCYFGYKDIINIIKEMENTIKFQYKLKDVEIPVKNYTKLIGIENEKEIKTRFEEITNQNILSKEHYNTTLNNKRLKILELNTEIYKKINSKLFPISIMGGLILIIINIKQIRKFYEESVILISLLVMYMSRIFLITFTSKLMFEEALNVPYLACIYNIQYIFTFLVYMYFIISILKKIKNNNLITNK